MVDASSRETKSRELIRLALVLRTGLDPASPPRHRGSTDRTSPMILFRFSLLRFSGRAVPASVMTMLFLVSPARSAGTDFRFEIVQVQPAGKDLTDVTVKLTHLPDGKPVTGAVIFQATADMGPSGMGVMTGKVTPQPAEPAGFYRFRTETGMAGKWALTLTAKIPGENDTVRGTVTFDAK